MTSAALTLGPALGPTTWEGVDATNHAQVWNGAECVGILLRLNYPACQEGGHSIPASRPYRFEPMEGSGLMAMASLHSEALLAELRGPPDYPIPREPVP